MKIKDVKNECVEHYEALIDTLIKLSIESEYQVGFDAIRLIFCHNSEFYKTANLDPTLNYPLGKDRPLVQHFPKVGEECDVVKPYITSTGFCGWTRCTVV